MPNNYDRGDTVRLVGTFIGSGGVIIEPASVYVLVKNNLGSVGTYGYGAPAPSVTVGGVSSVVRVASGLYYMDIVPSADPPNGLWTYRFDSGGGVTAAAGEQAFNVRLTNFL